MIFGFSMFTLTIIISMIYGIYKIKSIIRFNDKYSILKATSIIPGTKQDILQALLDYKNKKQYDNFTHDIEKLDENDKVNQINQLILIKNRI